MKYIPRIAEHRSKTEVVAKVLHSLDTMSVQLKESIVAVKWHHSAGLSNADNNVKCIMHQLNINFPDLSVHVLATEGMLATSLKYTHTG